MASQDTSFFDLFASSGTDDFLQQLDVNDVFSSDVLGRESGLSVLESVFSEPNLFESAMMTTATEDTLWAEEAPPLATSPARRNSAVHHYVSPPLQPPAEFELRPEAKVVGTLVTPFQPECSRRTQSESAAQSTSPRIQALSPLSHSAMPLSLTPPALAVLHESSDQTGTSRTAGPSKRAKYHYSNISTSAVELHELISPMETHNVEGRSSCCGQQLEVQVIKAVKISSTKLADMVQRGFKRFVQFDTSIYRFGSPVYLLVLEVSCIVILQPHHAVSSTAFGNLSS
jgi:hypothetical protein